MERDELDPIIVDQAYTGLDMNPQQNSIKTFDNTYQQIVKKFKG